MQFFNSKTVTTILKSEREFAEKILELLPQHSNATKQEDDVLLEESKNTEAKKAFPKLPNKAKASRAKSLVELQKRLDAISARKRLNYKEKLLKKNIKNKIKRKGKLGEKNAAQKQERLKKEMQNEVAMKEEISEERVTPSASSNDSEKMVFSKFDFSNLGKKKHKKEKHDPQKMLEDLKKQKEKLERLRASGEVDKAAEMKEKSAWKSALAKAQGEKVRDDPELLTKSIKKREQKLKQSRKKWEARQENVKKGKEERQRKRQENIDKKKKEKKVKTMKKAVKRGKIIPGF